MPTNPEEIRQPLTEHLDELRRRLIRALIAFGIGTALCYNYAESIYRALLRPLTANLPADSHLIFTELTEAFLTYFKMALWGGFVLASPVIFYQAWRFVSPGLYRKERRLVVVFSAWSTLGFLAGMAAASCGPPVPMDRMARSPSGLPGSASLRLVTEPVRFVVRLSCTIASLPEGSAHRPRGSGCPGAGGPPSSRI